MSRRDTTTPMTMPTASHSHSMPAPSVRAVRAGNTQRYLPCGHLDMGEFRPVQCIHEWQAPRQMGLWV